MTRSSHEDFCPVFHHAIELIGRRWTGVVLRAMLRGATRFSDIAAEVPNLSDKMLADRLKELEAEGLITRIVVPTIPVRVEYRLTEKGRALEGVVKALDEWADRWVGPCPAAGPAGERAVGKAVSRPKRGDTTRARRGAGPRKRPRS